MAMRQIYAFGAAFLLAASCQAAHAGLFVPDSTFQVEATGAPDSFDDTVTLTPGVTQSLDGGVVDLTVSVVSGGGSNEWLVFDYTTTSASFGTSGYDWSISEVGLQAVNPVSLIGAYLQFSTNGTVQTPTSSIFGCCVITNPVPGWTGTGFGNSGYSSPLTNPLGSLGTYVDPWNYLNDTGIDSTTVNGYTEALEFAPTTAVPEPATWALMLLGFAGAGFAGFRRAGQARAARA